MLEGLELHAVDVISLSAIHQRGNQHRHDWDELVYVLSGSYRVQVDGENAVGGVGASFCYPAGHPHRPHRPLRTDAGARILLVQWSGGAPEQLRRAEDPQGRLRSGLMWLWYFFHDRPAPPSDVVAGVLRAVLHQRQARTSAAGDGIVSRACRFMGQNLRDNLDLAQVAAVTGVGASTLNRSFRAELDTTPMAWRRQLKVETALVLLRDSKMDLATIAREVGVATPFHLSYLVKAATGRSPSSWRPAIASRPS